MEHVRSKLLTTILTWIISVPARWNTYFIFGAHMAATLPLNPAKEEIVLDPGSASWLQVVRRNDGKSRTCSVPLKYFDVLKAHGYLDGTAGDAKLTPVGRAKIVEAENAEKAEKKPSKKKKSK